MSTHDSRRISRKAAEQLLGGAAVPGAGPDPLVRVLAAAAAPGHEPELAGEAKAVTAFQAHHLVPVTTPRRGQMIKSPVAKLLTAKAVAATLAVFVTGGVALAASSGALSGPTSSQPSGTSQPTAPPTGTATSSPGAPTGLANLCHTLASQVASIPSAQVSASIGSQAGLEQALGSPALGQVVSGSSYASLVSAANVSTAVPDYCALLLGLPQLPQPGDLTQLPASILIEILPAMQVSALGSILTSLPRRRWRRCSASCRSPACPKSSPPCQPGRCPRFSPCCPLPG